MGNAIIAGSYTLERTAVAVKADLRLGWRRLRKTWGYFGHTWIPHRDNTKLRLQINLSAQPETFDAWAAEFPSLEAEGQTDVCSWSLSAQSLALVFPLGRLESWGHTPQGRARIAFSQKPFFSLDRNRCYDLSALVVCHDDSPLPIPNIRVWLDSKHFVHGGRPESSRRRH